METYDYEEEIVRKLEAEELERKNAWKSEQEDWEL